MKARYVWIWLPEKTEPVLCGRLFWDGARAHFAYVRSYSANPEAISIHPDWLPSEPTGSRHGSVDDDALPPVFVDIAPGAWGEYALRKLLGKSLNAFEYLVHPTADRIGAFEFTEKATTAPETLAPLTESAVEELRAAITALDDGKELPHELRLVWKHGTSVGGRWPKASVIDEAGSHWLLKFGSRLHRKQQQPRVEALGMSLAKRCGIEVPEFRLEHNKVQPFLWVRRFDRLGAGERRHVMSVRSFAELSERDALDRASYPEVGAALRRLAKDSADAGRWFDRMILNIIIGNTDDHPLNHLFFWDGTNLSLAPAFDVEPQTDQILQHSMRIGPEGARGTMANALAACGEFGLTSDEAEARIQHIARTVFKNWRDLAAEHGLDKAQIKELHQAAILLKETGATAYLPS